MRITGIMMVKWRPGEVLWGMLTIVTSSVSIKDRAVVCPLSHVEFTPIHLAGWITCSDREAKILFWPGFGFVGSLIIVVEE